MEQQKTPDNSRTRFQGILNRSVIFALYLFVFLLTECTINAKADKLLGTNTVNLVYAVGIFCSGIGYCLFHIINRCKKLSARTVLWAVIVIYAVDVALFMLTKDPALHVITSFVALLSFGYVGGAVHTYLAITLCDNAATGRAIGFGGAFAVILQFFMQNSGIHDIFMLVCMIISASFIAISLNRGEDSTHILKQSVPPIEYAAKKSKIVGVASVALMTVIVALNDGVLTKLHALGNVNIVSYERLFFAVGLIAAGILADVKKRRFLPLTTICAMFMSVIAALFLVSPEQYFINASILYFYSGFYVMFLTLYFVDIAPHSDKPTVWAGMVESFAVLSQRSLCCRLLYCFPR